MNIAAYNNYRNKMYDNISSKARSKKMKVQCYFSVLI